MQQAVKWLLWLSVGTATLLYPRFKSTGAAVLELIHRVHPVSLVQTTSASERLFFVKDKKGTLV